MTHHMDPVPHVPPEEMGFQHLASEAEQSPEETRRGSIICRNPEPLETSLKHQTKHDKTKKKLNMLRDVCFAKESL